VEDINMDLIFSISETSPVIDAFISIHKHAWNDFRDENKIDEKIDDKEIDPSLKIKFIEERLLAFIQDVAEQHLVHSVVEDLQKDARLSAKTEVENLKLASKEKQL